MNFPGYECICQKKKRRALSGGEEIFPWSSGALSFRLRKIVRRPFSQNEGSWNIGAKLATSRGFVGFERNQMQNLLKVPWSSGVIFPPT